MKRLLCRTLAIALFCVWLPATSFADENVINLLWGLPFTSFYTAIEETIKEERGIICKHESHPKSSLLPAYVSVDSVNDGDFFLFGYPFHFRYTTDPKVYSLWFNIYGSWDERCEGISAIISGFIDKYGIPNDACCDLYSLGYIVWRNDSMPATHEMFRLNGTSATDFSPDVILSNWKYAQYETELELILIFYNIKMEIYTYSQQDNRSYVSASFFNGRTGITREPIFEQHTNIKPTRDPGTPGGL